MNITAPVATLLLSPETHFCAVNIARSGASEFCVMVAKWITGKCVRALFEVGKDFGKVNFYLGPNEQIMVLFMACSPT